MISIITPAWNRNELTAKFLLQNSIHYPYDQSIEWIIIDNGSTDGTDNTLNHWSGIFGNRLVIIRNNENKGFPAACNCGANLAKGDILIFLNNDVIINSDYVTPLEKALHNNLLSLAGPQLINFDTGWNVFGGKLISYLAGWCLAINHHAFDELGQFDERYTPAYYEDIDLSFGALKRGYDLQQVWVPLEHIGEQTGITQFEAEYQQVWVPLEHIGEQTGITQFEAEHRKKITEANKVKFAKKWGLEL